MRKIDCAAFLAQFALSMITGLAFAQAPPALLGLYEIRIAERKSGKSIRALPKLKHLEQAHA